MEVNTRVIDEIEAQKQMWADLDMIHTNSYVIEQVVEYKYCVSSVLKRYKEQTTAIMTKV